MREKLAQVLHSLGLTELEKRARANEFAMKAGGKDPAKLTLIRELDLALEANEHRPFAVALMGRLRDRVIHGEFDQVV